MASLCPTPPCPLSLVLHLNRCPTCPQFSTAAASAKQPLCAEASIVARLSEHTGQNEDRLHWWVGLGAAALRVCASTAGPGRWAADACAPESYWILNGGPRAAGPSQGWRGSCGCRRNCLGLPAICCRHLLTHPALLLPPAGAGYVGECSRTGASAAAAGRRWRQHLPPASGGSTQLVQYAQPGRLSGG